MKICYKYINGRATDIRFVEDAYTAQSDEVITDGDTLPIKASLDNPTVEQLTLELQTKANELTNVRLAFAACLEILFTFTKNPALFNTSLELKQAVIDRYKTKL